MVQQRNEAGFIAKIIAGAGIFLVVVISLGMWGCHTYNLTQWLAMLAGVALQGVGIWAIVKEERQK